MTEPEIEEIGEAEVRHRFERGDYHDPSDVSLVKRWLGSKDKEREVLAACQRASISASLDASRAARLANHIAIAAVIIAAIGAHEEISSIISALLDAVKP